MRSIGLERIHEAAGAIYDTVVRTPLVGADLPGSSDLFTLDEVRRAMMLTAERAHLVCEGAAGCAIAAAISGRAGPGRTVAVVSGGNIDLPRFAELVGACENAWEQGTQTR